MQRDNVGGEKEKGILSNGLFFFYLVNEEQ